MKLTKRANKKPKQQTNNNKHEDEFQQTQERPAASVASSKKKVVNNNDDLEAQQQQGGPRRRPTLNKSRFSFEFAGEIDNDDSNDNTVDRKGENNHLTLWNDPIISIVYKNQQSRAHQSLNERPEQPQGNMDHRFSFASLQESAGDGGSADDGGSTNDDCKIAARWDPLTDKTESLNQRLEQLQQENQHLLQQRTQEETASQGNDLDAEEDQMVRHFDFTDPRNIDLSPRRRAIDRYGYRRPSPVALSRPTYQQPETKNYTTKDSSDCEIVDSDKNNITDEEDISNVSDWDNDDDEESTDSEKKDASISYLLRRRNRPLSIIHPHHQAQPPRASVGRNRKSHLHHRRHRWH